MKRHQTPGADLLRAARNHFKAELLPLLPEDKRLGGLMLMAALGMAARELEAVPPGDEAARISELLDVPVRSEPDLRKQLAEAIRTGRFDGDPKLFALAEACLRWRLAETDPRALEPAEK